MKLDPAQKVILEHSFRVLREEMQKAWEPLLLNKKNLFCTLCEKIEIIIDKNIVAFTKKASQKYNQLHCYT